jgi:hypothetical protein
VGVVEVRCLSVGLLKSRRVERRGVVSWHTAEGVVVVMLTSVYMTIAVEQAGCRFGLLARFAGSGQTGSACVGWGFDWNARVLLMGEMVFRLDGLAAVQEWRELVLREQH